MNFKDYLPQILQNNRASMRDCALNYRRAQKRGSFSFMVKWLILATEYRRINQGLREAA